MQRLLSRGQRSFCSFQLNLLDYSAVDHCCLSAWMCTRWSFSPCRGVRSDDDVANKMWPPKILLATLVPCYRPADADRLSGVDRRRFDVNKSAFWHLIQPSVSGFFGQISAADKQQLTRIFTSQPFNVVKCRLKFTCFPIDWRWHVTNKKLDGIKHWSMI